MPLRGVGNFVKEEYESNFFRDNYVEIGLEVVTHFVR